MAQSNKMESFVKNSALFMIGSVFSKLLGILLLPIYTTYISTEDFGTYDITIVYVSLISSFLFFEIWSAVLRYMYDYEYKKKLIVVKAADRIFFLSAVTFAVVNMVFCYFMKIDYAIILTLYGITTSFSTYVSFISRGMGQNTDFALSGIINTGTCLGMNILFVIFLKMNYSALYIGAVLGNVFQTFYLLARMKVVKAVIKTKFDLSLSKELFRYALPLCLNTAAYWLLHSCARVIYNYMCGDSASGLFSVGNKFSSIIVLATTCFSYAWQDLSFSSNKEKDSNKLYSLASKKYLSFLICFLCIALPAIKVAFPILVKGDFTEAFRYIPLFLLVSVASGYSSFIGNIFYAIKKTKIISISTIISGIVTIASAVPLINVAGANGVNIAIFIGFSVNIIIRFIILKKQIDFKVPVKEILFFAIWLTATSVAYLNASLTINIAICMINVVVFGLVFKSDLISFYKKLKHK